MHCHTGIRLVRSVSKVVCIHRVSSSGQTTRKPSIVRRFICVPNGVNVNICHGQDSEETVAQEE